MMMKHTAFVVLVALATATAAGLSACVPAVPANPTWKDDVRPLLVARCIRCHNNPGGVDPDARGSTAQEATFLAKPPPPAGFNFDWPDVASIPAGPLGLLKALGPAAARGKGTPIQLMPPLPAEPLADWEIQIIDNWSKEDPLR